MRRGIYAILCLSIIIIIACLVVPSTKCSRNTELFSNRNITYDSVSVGVIVINTGTPASLSKKDVQCFIGDILSDGYVMGMPAWARTTIARKIIAPMRVSSSLKKYSLIWGDSIQSPLLLNTVALADSIEQALSLPIAVAMRYGTPSVEQAVAELEKRCPNMEEVVLLPLFPQYAESSYLTAVEAVRRSPCFMSGKYNLRVVGPYYDNHSYITALANKINAYSNGCGDFHLLFSYHSLPLSHVEAGRFKGKDFDYEYQCRETARLTAQQLGITDFSVVYASAMGKKWQKPMLEDFVGELPAKGVKKIAVVAPGFIIDNLETLYDINISARRIFEKNGGESFLFIPCLNDQFSCSAAIITSKHILQAELTRNTN